MILQTKVMNTQNILLIILLHFTIIFALGVIDECCVFVVEMLYDGGYYTSLTNSVLADVTLVC